MNKLTLKCPRCQGHNAWVELLYNEKRDEYYRQKFCGCGYAGARRYTKITRERMLELRRTVDTLGKKE